MQVLVRQLGNLATTRGALDKALLDKIRLIDILYRACVFAHSRSDGVQPYRPALELVDNGAEQLVVDLVEPKSIDIERLQSILGYFQIDRTIALDLRKVPHTAQQRIGDTRRSTTAAGNLTRCFAVDSDTEQTGTAGDNTCKNIGIVILKVAIDTETSTKRRGKQPRPCGGTNEGETIEVYLYGAGGWYISIIISMR